MNWYPGAPTQGSYYPSYTGGYAPPLSDSVPPSINTVGSGGILSQPGLSTVGWGLALLAAAFLVMHLSEEFE